MAITAVSADGMEHEFPDGTPQNVIDFAIKRYTINNIPQERVQTGPQYDSFWTNHPVGRVLDAFNVGASHNWGKTAASEDSDFSKAMRDYGFFPTYEENDLNIMKSINQAFMRPTAQAVQTLFQGIPAVIGGAAQMVTQIGEETGTQRVTRPIAAIPEVLPSLIGTPAIGPVGPAVGQLVRAFMPRPTLPAILAEGRGARVIGEGEAGWLGVAKPVEFTGPRQLELPLPGFRQPRAAALETPATAEAAATEAAPGIIEAPKGPAAVERPTVPGEPLPTRSLVNEQGQFLLERIETVDDVGRALQEGITHEQRGVIPTTGELLDLSNALGMPVADLTRFTTRGEVDAATRMVIQSASEVKAAADAVPSGRVAVGTSEIARFLAAKEKHELIIEGLMTERRVLPDLVIAELRDRGFSATEIANMSAEDAHTAMRLPKKVEAEALQQEIATVTEELNKARVAVTESGIENVMDRVIAVEQLENRLAALNARAAAPPPTTPPTSGAAGAGAGGAPPTAGAGGGAVTPPGGGAPPTQPPGGGPPPPTGDGPPPGVTPPPTGGGPPIPPNANNVARGAANLPTPAQVARYVGDSRVFTYAYELFINSILSGIGTQTTYLVQQAVMPVVHAVEVLAAGMTGAAMRGLGLAQGGVRMGEFQAGLYSLRKGSQDGVVAAWQAAQTGIPLVLQGQTSATWLSQYGGRAIPGWLGAVINLPGRIGFTVPDAYFRTIGMAQGRAEVAYRAAYDEGFTPGTAAFSQRVAYWETNPTTAMLNEAREGANARALMGQGGPMTRYFTTALDQPILEGTPIGGRWGRFIAPFIHIGDAIWREGALERTPVGLLSGNIRANLLGRNGEAAQQAQIGRMAVTSAVITALATEFDNETITGPGPQTPEGRETWRALGKQPFSIKLGNSYYSYEALGPLAVQLGMLGAGFEAWDYLSKGDKEKMFTSIFASIHEGLINDTWLRGPADLIKAIKEPHRYAAQYIDRQLTSFIPFSAGLRWWAQQVDPYQREVFDMWDRVKSIIPYASETLHPKIGWDGEPIPTRESTPPGLAFYTRDITNDPVAKALDRVGMSVPSVKPEINGVKLTPQQWEDYARMAGKATRFALQTMVTAPGFENIDPGMQRKLMQKQIDATHKQIGSIIQAQNPEVITTGIMEKIRELLSTSTQKPKRPFVQPESIPSRALGR